MTENPLKSPENTSKSLEAMLRKIHPHVQVKLGAKAKSLVSIKREAGNRYVLEMDPERMMKADEQSCLIQMLTAIDSLNSKAEMMNDKKLAKELETYEEYRANPAYGIFYGVLDQFIALKRRNIAPIYYGNLVKGFNSQMESLSKKYQPVPKHIQFLLGLAGAEKIEDEEVLESIQELNGENIISLISDPRRKDGEKLTAIHEHILPLYEYFLRKDKKEWKPVKQKKAEKVRDEVKEIIENKTPEGSKEDKKKPSSKNEEKKDEDTPPPQKQSGEQESSEEEGGESKGPKDDKDKGKSEGAEAPDHKDEYRTPEDGKFEKDPNGNGYKLEIFPALKGYYVVDQKSKFNVTTKKWTNISKHSIYTKAPAFSGKAYTIQGNLKGTGIKALPVPQGYAIDPSSFQCTGVKPTLHRDENGAFFMEMKGPCDFKVNFYKETKPKFPSPLPEDSEKLSSSPLSGPTQSLIKRLSKLTDANKKAKEVRDYIRKNHFYPQGKDGKEILNNAKEIQAALNGASGDHLQNLDQSKHLECFSANTLMVGILRALGVAARMVTGHNVNSLNKAGKAEINSANGHGWCMIFDGKTWIRFDATPDQDPNDPANKKDPKESKQDAEQEKKGKKSSESAEDGGEDTKSDSDKDGGEGEAGEGSESSEGGEGGGESKEKEKNDGKKSEKNPAEEDPKKEKKSPEGKNDDEDGEGESGDKEGGELTEGGEDKISEWDNLAREAEEGMDENFDPEEAFKKMYDELNETQSEGPKEEDLEEAADKMAEEEEEIQVEDPYERELGTKYPGLSQEQIRELGDFIKSFREELSRINRISNPAYIEGISENATLEDELRSILDRVISRSIKEKDTPRFPVADGNQLTLINPVQLYVDHMSGQTESYSFNERTTIEEEELKVVKVRRRKILDGSGSMSGDKLTMQQQIEVLENKITAEKQKELDELSDQLDRDLRLETETWQFGVTDPRTGRDFVRLKALSSTFHEVEQAAVWKRAGQATGGTNDFDPLESIYSLLAQENEEAKLNKDGPRVFHQIRLGFLVRERNALKDLESRQDELTPGEKTYLNNLSKQSPKHLFQWLINFIPPEKVTPQEQQFFQTGIDDRNANEKFKEWAQRFMRDKNLSEGERQFFQNLDLAGKNLADVYEEWQQAILEENGNDIEPILEIIEVSSDGGSNDQQRLKRVLQKLRGLGVAVMAYGLGSDGRIVEQVYQNEYNPSEGGHFCSNLLTYPKKKAEAWHNILDKI